MPVGDLGVLAAPDWPVGVDVVVVVVSHLVLLSLRPSQRQVLDEVQIRQRDRQFRLTCWADLGQARSRGT